MPNPDGRMSDSFVTQCPHCQTSFRVSHAQLGMARGVVRCGACLQVFNAAQQLLNQSTETGQPPAVDAPAVTTPEASEPTIWIWTKNWPSSKSEKSSPAKASANRTHPKAAP
jgi:hypothetical protein